MHPSPNLVIAMLVLWLFSLALPTHPLQTGIYTHMLKVLLSWPVTVQVGLVAGYILLLQAMAARCTPMVQILYTGQVVSLPKLHTTTASL